MQHINHMPQRLHDLLHIFIHRLNASRKGEDQAFVSRSCHSSAEQGIGLLHAVFHPDHFHDAGNLFLDHAFYHFRADIPWPDAGASCGEDKIHPLFDSIQKECAQCLFIIRDHYIFDIMQPFLFIEESVQMPGKPWPAAVFIFTGIGAVAQGDHQGTVNFRYIFKRIACPEVSIPEHTAEYAFLRHDAIAYFAINRTAVAMAFFAYLRYFKFYFLAIKPV